MGLTRPRAAQIYDIDYKQAVRVITTSNITLSGGAPLVVDGVTLSLNDRILVSGQNTASQNGIYKVTVTGTGSNGTWARTSDNDATGELLSGTIVMVTEGSVYADTSWKLTTNNPITIGTTALTFEINTGNAFGVISANGTSVVANSATGTVTFSTGNNIVITGNATTDTITFAVRDDPTFWGNVNPGANVTYDLGNTTNRWRDIWLANSTIYLGNAQISANATAVIITNPAGGTTVLSGASPAVNANTVVATGNITGGNLITSGVLSVTGNANVGNLGATNANLTAITVSGNANVGNLGTAGQITASGNITGDYLLANITFASGYNTTRLFNGTSEANIGTSGGNANITIGGVSNVAVFSTVGANISGTLGVTGNVTGGNLVTTGAVSTGTLTASGNVTVAGNLTVSGNVISVNVTNLNVVDPIIGLGRGANNTPLTSNDGKDRGQELWYYTTTEQAAFMGYDNSAGKLIAATNVTVSNDVVTVNNYGNLIVGGLESTTISATGNANVGNLGTAGQITATGNITGGNLVTAGQLTASGNITGNYLLANITFASGYNTTRLFNGTSEANIGTANGNLSITIAGTSNVMVVTTTGVAVTGTSTVSGNANVGNLGTAGQITATGNITGGNINLSGNIVDTGALTLVTGSSGNVSLAPNGTNVIVATTTGANIAGTLNATGNANVGNLGTAGLIVATGNITTVGNISGGNILGNGRNLSGIETFRSFAVAGGNTITADSILDTFTFNAGTGITLVADPTTDTLTIAASGEGSDVFVDGADFGTVDEVVTTTDDLGSVADAVTSQADLGFIVTAGVFYPDQIVFPSYTVATVPSASPPGQMIYVSNESGGAVPAFSDGTNWRRVTDRAIIT